MQQLENPTIIREMDWDLRRIYQEYLAKKKCKCGSKLGNCSIKHYEHKCGWSVPTFKNRQWIYVKCRKCGREISLNKLGFSKKFVPEIEKPVRKYVIFTDNGSIVEQGFSAMFDRDLKRHAKLCGYDKLRDENTCFGYCENFCSVCRFRLYCDLYAQNNPVYGAAKKIPDLQTRVNFIKFAEKRLPHEVAYFLKIWARRFNARYKLECADKEENNLELIQ